MKWSSSFRRLLSSLLSLHQRAPGRRVLHRRPTVEVLEDRSVPAVTGLMTPAAGLLGSPGNAGQVVMAVGPVAGNDWTDTDGTTSVAVSVLANDTPSPGAVLLPASIIVVAGPQHGQARVSQGQIVYTANAAFTGTDSFQYTVRDSLGGTSNPATVSVRVNRPVAADDWTDTDGTTPVTIAVLANDSDPDGNQHIDPTQHTGAYVTKLSNPAHGSAVLNADGSFTYTAVAGFTGTDSFRYSVTDDNGGTSEPATVFVRVNVPTANDDLASFSGTTPVTIDVLANDTDPDGNGHLVPASVTVVTLPLHGSVNPGPMVGQLTYTAAAGFSGTDSFRYTVSDDNGATSAPGTVTVVGSAPNQANGDFTDTDGTTPVTIPVLANDSAPGGASLIASSVVVTTAPKHGSVKVDPVTGNITYTASASFTGTDTFQYTVAQYTVAYGNGHTFIPLSIPVGKDGSRIVSIATGAVLGPATVSVRVNRPVAADDWTDTDGTTSVTIAVLANDSDPDGNQHIDPTQHTGAYVTKLSNPAHGSAVLNADGTFTYTAVAGFTGTDSFQYTVTDDNGGTSMPATVFVRVNVPTAADDFAQASGTAQTAIAVLANDTDPDGNGHLVPGSVTIVTQPLHGSVNVAPSTGVVTYTAAAGWGGTDTFRYTVSDDNGATSSPGTVVVNTVIPVAAGGFGVGTPQQGIAFSVMAGASDQLGTAALSSAVVTVSSAPQHGRATFNPQTHQITYVPNAGFTGADSFSYTITDASGAKSAPVVLSVRVLPPASSALLALEEQLYLALYELTLIGLRKHPAVL